MHRTTRISRGGASDIHYYPGRGDGTFGAGVPVWTGQHPTGVALLDLNHDGVLDVAIDTVGATAYQQEVLLGQGHGTFASSGVAAVEDLPRTRLFTRDLDGDGTPDVVTVDSGAIVVMLGKGDGTLAGPVRSPAPAAGQELAFADFNGDGHLDFVTIAGGALDAAQTVVGVALGRGDGTFLPPLFYEAGVGNTVSVADIDGDGRVDIIVDNPNDQASVLYGRCL